MEDTLTYVSTCVHLALIIVLWWMMYRKMAQKKWRLNKSIWIAGIVSMLYVIIIANMALDAVVVWFDYLFFAPCYLLFYILIYTLLLNLVYTIVLLIRKSNSRGSRQ